MKKVMTNITGAFAKLISNLINGGITRDLPILDKISTRNANLVIVVVVVVCFGFIGLALYADLQTYFYILAANVFGMIVGLVMIRRGLRETGKLCAWCSGGLMVFLSNDIIGRSRYSDLCFLVLVLCPLAFFNRHRWLSYGLSFSAAAFWMAAMLGPAHLLFQNSPNVELFHPWMFQIVSLFILIALFTYGQRQHERALIDVEHKTGQLMRLSQMIALGEMAGDIAHEINNPLQHILSRSERIQFVAEQNPNLQSIGDDAVKIQQTVVRVSKIIKGLRGFSRMAESDAHSECDLEHVINETVDFCRECFRGKHVEIRTNVQSEIRVMGNMIELSQVFLNLLNNAYDAIADEEGPWIEISSEIRGSDVAILVTDAGKGIAPEIAEKILNPFFTTKELGKGTGLGLSVSKDIVEAHGGKLRYDHTCPNTRFVVLLPVFA